MTCNWCFNDASLVITLDNGVEHDCCEICLDEAMEEYKGQIQKVIETNDDEVTNYDQP